MLKNVCMAYLGASDRAHTLTPTHMRRRGETRTHTHTYLHRLDVVTLHDVDLERDGGLSHLDSPLVSPNLLQKK